jgi:NitT/TauT family transport system permease protein
MGRSNIIRDIASPYIEILRPIPAVAWIPLAILIWPTEEGSII